MAESKVYDGRNNHESLMVKGVITMMAISVEKRGKM
jgi:hypothetical protein